MARATSVVVRPAASRARRTSGPSTTTSGLAPTKPWRTAKSLSTSGPIRSPPSPPPSPARSSPPPARSSSWSVIVPVPLRIPGVARGPLGPAAGRLGRDALAPPDLGEAHAPELVVEQRPPVVGAGVGQEAAQLVAVDHPVAGGPVRRRRLPRLLERHRHARRLPLLGLRPAPLVAEAAQD